jgi:hypothetical protein
MLCQFLPLDTTCCFPTGEAQALSVLPLATVTFLSSYSSVFWDTTLCSPVKVNRHFGITYRFHFQGWSATDGRNEREADYEDRSDILLRNVGWLLLDYTALCPIIQHSLLQITQICRPSLLCSGYRVFLSRGSGHTSDHALKCSTEFKNVWSCTSTFIYIYMACCLIN